MRALEGVSPGDSLQVPLLARVGIVCALSAQLDVLHFLAQVACDVSSAAARLHSWCQTVSHGQGFALVPLVLALALVLAVLPAASCDRRGGIRCDQRHRSGQVIVMVAFA